MPITPCTKSGTYEIVPNIAIPTSAMHATLAGDDRVAQQRRTAGSARRARRSTSANAASSDGRDDERADDVAARPGVVAAAPDEPEQERAGAGREQPGAEPVDRVLGARGARRGIVSEITTSASPPTGRLTRKTQRQLVLSTMNPPTAGPMIDDGGEDGADQPLPAAAVARRHDRADHREREREEAAGADALDRAEDDELRHPLREAAERGADEEDRDRDQEQRPPPVDVAELAVERHASPSR